MSKFQGSGATFPLSIAATGGVHESAGIAKIEQSIRIILGTQRGERLMRPSFGCDLKSLVYAPISDATANLARHYVQEGLSRWEPRVEVLDVAVEAQNREGVLVIHIQYRVKATHETHSMIYPFYLERR